jgi:hypothetical protein
MLDVDEETGRLVYCFDMKEQSPEIDERKILQKNTYWGQRR